MPNPKYPGVEVQLTGKDGNAFSILGNVHRALTRANVPKEEIEEFLKEAQGGDYNHLLRTVQHWVSVS